MYIKVIFYKNKVIIHNIYNDYNYLHILIQQINMNYYYCINTCLIKSFNYQLYYNKEDYNCIKYFDNIVENSYYKLYKNFLYKIKFLFTNTNNNLFNFKKGYLEFLYTRYSRLGNIFYLYFIYKKYYVYYYNMKHYHNNLYCIPSKKKFNCRDLYKIFVFI